MINYKSELLSYLKGGEFFHANTITRAAFECCIINKKLKKKEKTTSLLCYFYRDEDDVYDKIFNLIKKNSDHSDIVYIILVILKDFEFDENIKNFIKNNIKFNTRCLSLLEKNWENDLNSLDTISEKSFGRERCDSRSSLSSISTKQSFSECDSRNSSSNNLLKSVKSLDNLIDDDFEEMFLIDQLAELFFKYFESYKDKLDNFYQDFTELQDESNEELFFSLIEKNRISIRPLINEEDINCLNNSLKYSLLVMFLLKTNINFPINYLKKIISNYWDEEMENNLYSIISDLCVYVKKLWNHILDDFGTSIMTKKIDELNNLISDSDFSDFLF